MWIYKIKNVMVLIYIIFSVDLISFISVFMVKICLVLLIGLIFFNLGWRVFVEKRILICI